METAPLLKLNSVGYLRLAYVATEITLHRRILLALCPSTTPELIQICRSVARERFMFAIDFVQSLKPQHLSSFWYFASPQNFALIAVFGTLLLSTATDSEDADFYRTKLREYRWTLKINSENGARFMKPAIALLDANTALLQKANNPANNPNHSNLAVTDSTESPQPDNRRGSAITSQTSTFSLLNGQISQTSEFNSLEQFAFATLSYTGRHPESTPTPAYSSRNTDEQSHEFGYELMSNADLWN